MKLKRFVGTRLREVMRNITEEMGGDAVILSKKQYQDEFEIVAATDYDEALMQSMGNAGDADAMAMGAATARANLIAAPILPQRNALLTNIRQRQDSSAKQLPPSVQTDHPATAETDNGDEARKVLRGTMATPSEAAEPVPQQAPETTQYTIDPQATVHPLIAKAVADQGRVQAELGSIRDLLESQLAALIWNDNERRDPMGTRVLRELTRLGIESDVAQRLVKELPPGISPEQARYLPLGILSKNLMVAPREESDRPSVTALVGQTGVGKTTTIAKLAARAVLRQGPKGVALVSTDHFRIGAAAQLEHYGKLLGVRVFPAYDADSLRQVLEMLRGYRTVLVDTAGLAPGDERLTTQLEVLRNGGDLRACLALAANAHSSSLDAAVRAYLPLRPAACILTKLDEAPNLGGAISVLIRHRLPLEYITDGQRVPEDIATANARELVCRAATVLKGSPLVAPDDMLMAERFGRLQQVASA